MMQGRNANAHGNPFSPRRIIQSVKNGMNPNAITSWLIQNDPAVRSAAELMSGKTPDEIGNMVHQRANEMGVDLNQLARQWGVHLPE